MIFKFYMLFKKSKLFSQLRAKYIRHITIFPNNIYVCANWIIESYKFNEDRTESLQHFNAW